MRRVVLIGAVVALARAFAYARAAGGQADAIGAAIDLRLVAVSASLAAAVALAALRVLRRATDVRTSFAASSPAPVARARTIIRPALAILVSATALFVSLESLVHVRAGLGFHPLTCLTGPVHANALPLLVALSILAAAVDIALADLGARAARAVRRMRDATPTLTRDAPLVATPGDVPARGWNVTPNQTRGPPSFLRF